MAVVFILAGGRDDHAAGATHLALHLPLAQFTLTALLWLPVLGLTGHINWLLGHHINPT